MTEKIQKTRCSNKIYYESDVIIKKDYKVKKLKNLVDVL